VSQVKLSGNARVLRVLRLGPTNQGEWFNPADGRKAITRLSARIYDLKKQGHKIEPSEVEGLAFEVYTLLQEAPRCKYAQELDRYLAGVEGTARRLTAVRSEQARVADPTGRSLNLPTEAQLEAEAGEQAQLFDLRQRSSAYDPEAA
jgi:hypothetical protein